ncbi:cytochrome C oxidase assembly factor [Perilla frutescens var. hirtella]|uniref:Cytochrome C oxidase assembly factor n=1 Tax=Perilla frutescens var. hirtella TaxID=608512 RepID=A0AAD4J278_PERFH|nr:cytochrome C oxidase assembly factor [Perilla frutescens var. frutescens]KAH6825842.1 cytochrome C oxidase assembly factor [Perilla frutescens var. hirtella]
MAKSCKGLAMELVKCLSESDCIKVENRSYRECAKETSPKISNPDSWGKMKGVLRALMCGEECGMGEDMGLDRCVGRGKLKIRGGSGFRFELQKKGRLDYKF